MQTIEANFQIIYQWNIVQEDQSDIIKVIIDFPESFKPDSITYELLEQNTIFRAFFNPELPIIEGLLYSPVKSFDTHIEKNQIIITFVKNDDTKWPTLMRDKNPITNKIDPNSAFAIFKDQVEISEDTEKLESFFSHSMACGYLPALMYALDMMEDDPTLKDSYLQILDLAAHKYQHPVALFKYATYLVDNGQKEEGFKYLSLAAQKGVGIAISLMGQMISPLSGIEFSEKDPVSALQLFEKVIGIKDEPIALYEAAKLYKAGVGCEKDIEKANNYYQRAKAVSHDLPDLPDYKEGVTILGVPVFIAAGVSVAAITAGTFIYSLFKRSRN